MLKTDRDFADRVIDGCSGFGEWNRGVVTPRCDFAEKQALGYAADHSLTPEQTAELCDYIHDGLMADLRANTEPCPEEEVIPASGR